MSCHSKDELYTYCVSISELWASQLVVHHRAHAPGDSTYIFLGTYYALGPVVKTGSTVRTKVGASWAELSAADRLLLGLNCEFRQ